MVAPDAWLHLSDGELVAAVTAVLGYTHRRDPLGSVSVLPAGDVHRTNLGLGLRTGTLSLALGGASSRTLASDVDSALVKDVVYYLRAPHFPMLHTMRWVITDTVEAEFVAGAGWIFTVPYQEVA